MNEIDIQIKYILRGNHSELKTKILVSYAYSGKRMQTNSLSVTLVRVIFSQQFLIDSFMIILSHGIHYGQHKISNHRQYEHVVKQR